MKLDNDGYLLLEIMIAMTVILFSILMIVSSINFLLLDEKKCKEELEMSIVLYEMASSLNLPQEKKELIKDKSDEKGYTIKNWEKDHLKIEREDLILEVKKNDE